MCPMSPALPCAPRYTRPSTVTPQPMPVPTFTTSRSCTDPPMPISPSAMTFTSLSTYTGHSYRPNGGELHGPGYTHAHDAHVCRCQARLGEHLLRQPVDLGEDDAGAVGDVD